MPTIAAQARAGQFVADELPGFEALRFALPQEDDGALWGTLVRRARPSREAKARPAVLYVHGFCDYFFQTHLCDTVEDAGFAFYALELRRYGRSLDPENRANQARDISDYFAEIDWALRYILDRHPKMGGAIAHSTGGLVLSHFLKHSKLRSQIPNLVLNSVFLKFNLRGPDALLANIVAKAGAIAPYRALPQKMPGSYGKTLHISEQGEWDYNLAYKPLFGFPMYPAWFRMIKRAQAEATAGLNLELPILSMRSSASHFAPDPPRPQDHLADIVLNVKDIAGLSPRLGRNVQACIIEEGMHDLYLSKKEARQAALSETARFLKLHQGS